MKSIEFIFSFQELDVRNFVQIIGDSNPIYYRKEFAQSYGYKTIPIPPTMPMIVYKFIDFPWNIQPPIIHRSQQSIYHKIMYIDQQYKGCITLTNHIKRNNLTFMKQTLQIYNKVDLLMFTGTSNLVAGGIS